MPVSRAEAWTKLCEWTETDSLRKHARAVELAMRAAALRYGAGPSDVEPFGVAGLLHDADYERWPEEHPARIVAWLRERGEDAVAHAVSAHFTGWGVPHETALDRALVACDELTGFLVACARVRPGGIATLEPPSVIKKLASKSFAAKVDRGEVAAGARLLEVELADHIAFLIGALAPHAAEIGAAPSAPAAP